MPQRDVTHPEVVEGEVGVLERVEERLDVGQFVDEVGLQVKE